MKALLADDDALFPEGLQNLLAGRGVDVVGAAADGLEALAMARALRPDVILMDVRMPRCDELAATRLIKSELPEIKVVMRTTSQGGWRHPGPQRAHRQVSHGRDPTAPAPPEPR